MNVNQINLQQKFSIEAKAAFDRLLTQTLWEAHPISFYHSATQELVSLTKYYLRKNKKNYVDKNSINLTWKVEGIVKNDKAKDKIVYQESPTAKSNVEICNYNEANEGKEQWYILIYVDNTIESFHRESFNPLIRNFISDLNKLVNAFCKLSAEEKKYLSSCAHLGFTKIKDVIKNLTSAIDSLFKSLTDDEIKSRIMLYYPHNPNEDISKGFLFYVDYSLEELNDKQTFNAENTFDDLFDIFVDGRTKDERRKIKGKVSSIKEYLKENFSDFQTEIAERKLDINTLKSELLCHPANFLMDKLRNLSKTCKVPICNQPLDYGVAGSVAKSGITFVAQDVKSVHELDIEKSIHDKQYPYALMRLIEKGTEVTDNSRAIVTPLYGKGQLIGVLYGTKTIDSDNRTSGYITTTQVEIFESIAHKIGTILQETRDYEYFKNLVEIKSRIGATDKIKMADDIVKEMAIKMRFVMNVSNAVDSFVTCDKTGFLFSDRTKQINKLEFKHEENNLIIFLPLMEQDEVLKVYTISLDLDIESNSKDIFEAHQEKLELFFNYCWGLTGYIAPQNLVGNENIGISGDSLATAKGHFPYFSSNRQKCGSRKADEK